MSARVVQLNLDVPVRKITVDSKLNYTRCDTTLRQPVESTSCHSLRRLIHVRRFCQIPDTESYSVRELLVVETLSLCASIRCNVFAIRRKEMHRPGHHPANT